MNRCRYCGEPVKKFIVGWVHHSYFPGVPTAMHIAKPVKRQR